LFPDDHWSGGSAQLLVGGVPGSVFVVEGVVAQASVEDADQPVREGAEGLVVGRAASPLAVVEQNRTAAYPRSARRCRGWSTMSRVVKTVLRWIVMFIDVFWTGAGQRGGANRITRVSDPHFSRALGERCHRGGMADRDHRRIGEGELSDDLEAASDGRLLTRAEGNTKGTVRSQSDNRVLLGTGGKDQSANGDRNRATTAKASQLIAPGSWSLISLVAREGAR
jgi:hypothetical protein